MKPRFTTLTWVAVEPPRVGVAVSIESATLSWTEADEPGGRGGGVIVVAVSFGGRGSSARGDSSDPSAGAAVVSEEDAVGGRGLFSSAMT